MIVEDNTTVAEDIRECLEGLNYTITTIVASGEEAVARAEQDRPDAVLMDIRLRGKMDGIEAAGHIFSRFEIPVLFLSAFSDGGMLERAKQVGSFGYLVKPFNDRELYAMLEMTLYKAGVEKERRNMESRLQQIHKMEAMTRMAGGVAHNFNNMLAAVIGNLELAQLEQAPTKQAEYIAAAHQATRRAAAMSGLMLTFLGQQTGQAAPLNLPHLVSRYLDKSREDRPNEIIIERHLPETGIMVRADALQLEQVLQALLTNAWEALEGMPETRITVTVSIEKADQIGENRYPPEWPASDARYACVTIRDTGQGMEAETQKCLFDPFFSTKFTGRGLGLPASLGIIRAHGGCLTVASQPGRGSTFRVCLPLLAQAALQPSAPVDSNTSMLQGKTVLLVEDEPLVRNMAMMLLTHLGMIVREARDGVEALDIFSKNPSDIHCVLCDLSMPRMNGWETLAALRKIVPDLPVILASGYDQERAMEGAASQQPQAFLNKPYTLTALRDMLVAVLGGTHRKS